MLTLLTGAANGSFSSRDATESVFVAPGSDSEWTWAECNQSFTEEEEEKWADAAGSLAALVTTYRAD